MKKIIFLIGSITLIFFLTYWKGQGYNSSHSQQDSQISNINASQLRNLQNDCGQEKILSSDGNSCVDTCEPGQFETPAGQICSYECMKINPVQLLDTCIKDCQRSNIDDDDGIDRCAKECGSREAYPQKIQNCFKDCSTNPRKCVSDCPQYYHKPADGQKCSRVCQTGQVLSLSLDTCLKSCPPAEFVNSEKSRCITSCPTGERANAAKQCQSKCGADQKYYQPQTLCVKQCTPKFTLRDRTQCGQTCDVGLFIEQATNICVSSCQSGSYISSDNTKCGQCAEGEYISSDSTKCLKQCPVGEFISKDKDSCVTSCSANQFRSSDDKSCLTLCPSNEIISKDSSQCLKQCPLFQKDAGRKECFQNCQKKETIQAQVQKCETNCNGKADQDQCKLACKFRSQIDQYAIKCDQNCRALRNQCVDACSADEFESETGKVCISQCQPHQRANPKKCQKYCSEEGQKIPVGRTGSCVENCPQGQYASVDGYLCLQSCPNNQYISGTGSQCVKQCENNEFISSDSSRCVSNCNNQRISYSKQSCLQECPSNHLIASNGNNCELFCQSGQFISLSTKSCSNTCDNQLITDKTSQCDGLCSSTEFQLNYVKDCLKSCGSSRNQDYEKKIEQQRKCLEDCKDSSDHQKCSLDCSDQGKRTVVEECQDKCYDSNNFKKATDQCKEKCKDRRGCSAPTCPESLFLSADKTSCLRSCQSASQLQAYPQSDRICVSQCQEDQFLSVDGLSCLPICLSSQFTFQKRCYQKCPGQLVASPTSSDCQQSCPQRYFKNDSSCLQCHSNCNTCNGTQATNCLSCFVGSTIDPDTGACISITCPDGKFLEGSQCINCNETCQTCQSLDACDSCFDDVAPFNGVCFNCQDNEFLTPTGCIRCPNFYKELQQDNFKDHRAKILEACDIQIQEKEIVKQINETLKQTIKALQTANEQQTTTQEEKTQKSQATIKMAVNLVSLIPERALQKKVFKESTPEVSVVAALIPQKKSQDQPVVKLTFSKQPQQENQQGQEGSQQQQQQQKPPSNSVSLPDTVLDQFKGAKLVAVELKTQVYELPPVQGVQPPVLSIEIHKQNKKQKIENLEQPIILQINLKTDISQSQQFVGVFYDVTQRKWISQGIQTEQVNLPNGIQKVILSVYHLTAFSVQVVEIQQEAQNVLFLYITLGIICGVLFVVFLLALLLDFILRSKPKMYPHTKIGGRGTFKKVFRYSLIYNLPCISVFSFYDPSIPACARALWISVIHWIIVLPATLIFRFSDWDVIQTAVAVALTFGIIFLANSWVVCIIRKTAKVHTNVQPEQKAGNRDTEPRDTENKDDQQSRPRITFSSKKRRGGLVALLVLALLLWAGGISAVYFLLDHVVQNTDKFLGFIGAYLGAILMGYLYVVMKSWIGSYLALRNKRGPSERQKCLNKLFVDTLTQDVARHFNQRPSTVEENQASAKRMKKEVKEPW